MFDLALGAIAVYVAFAVSDDDSFTLELVVVAFAVGLLFFGVSSWREQTKLLAKASAAPPAPLASQEESIEAIVHDILRMMLWLATFVVIVGIPLSFVFPFKLVDLIGIASYLLADALGNLWTSGRLASWERNNDARLLAAAGGDEPTYYRRSPRL